MRKINIRIDSFVLCLRACVRVLNASLTSVASASESVVSLAPYVMYIHASVVKKCSLSFDTCKNTEINKKKFYVNQVKITTLQLS